MASIDFTNGVTLSDASWADDVDVAAYSVLTSVSGTNTITATGAATYSYSATRTPIWLIPANTNTAATTLNVTPSGASALGAKNVFWNGAACVGGELRQNVPAAVIYDGTQYHIIANGFNAPFLDTHPVAVGSADSTKKVRLEVDGLTTGTTRVLTVPDADFTLRAAVLATEQASTSGTSIDFTGIPSWVTKIIIQLASVSGNGTSSFLVQLGDSGGVETTGYVASGGDLVGAAASASTAGFPVGTSVAAASVYSGHIVLTLENAASFRWICSGVISRDDGGQMHFTGGRKALSAALDRVRFTTVNGTDAFDAGAINILYE